MTQCKAKYIIQVGSWTKLLNGQVQEDTRAIMEMMGKVYGVNLEDHVANVGNFWKYVGVLNHFKGRYAVVQGEPHVVIHDGSDEDYVIEHEQHLFIPYEELQKMLNTPVEAPKLQSLLNTKLDCRKPDGTVDGELSRAFQEACFEQGIKWMDFSSDVKNTEDPFLYVGTHLCFGDTVSSFKGSKYKQINFTYSRKFEWEATEVKPP